MNAQSCDLTLHRLSLVGELTATTWKAGADLTVPPGQTFLVITKYGHLLIRRNYVLCNGLKHCSLVFILSYSSHRLLSFSSGGSAVLLETAGVFDTQKYNNAKAPPRNAVCRFLPAFGRWERSCWCDMIRDMEANWDRSSSWESGRRKDNTPSFRSSPRSPTTSDKRSANRFFWTGSF